MFAVRAREDASFKPVCLRGQLQLSSAIVLSHLSGGLVVYCMVLQTVLLHF